MEYSGRSKRILQMTQKVNSPDLSPTTNKSKCECAIEDHGYESSPAPSLDISFNVYSDDSVEDPSYCPSDSEVDLEIDEYQSSFQIYDDSASSVDLSNEIAQENQLKELCNINSDTHSEEFQNISQSDTNLVLRKTKKKKRTICKFCLLEVTNFERHLERNHTDSRQVQDMLSYPKCHVERKKIISLIRNSGHFTEYLKGNIKPKYNFRTENKEYYPCYKCKALLSKKYLSRHKKRCILREPGGPNNSLAASQTLIACALDQNNTIHKLNVKEQVFTKMKADQISLVAKTDSLICNFGENYLKKHKREQLTYVCSNKMRELARFLILFRKLTNNPNYGLHDTLKPSLFDIVIECAKKLGGYDIEKKSYKSPSLPAHLGTSLKHICDLYIRLILKKDQSVTCTNIEDTLKNTKRFRELIETQWTTEISSLAFKDLQEKKWEKPVILPLTQDVRKFKEYVTNVADKAVAVLKTDQNIKKELKNLIHASLTLTILFNRKRIGDVQYTKLKTYTESTSSNVQEECEKALSESEKVLTKYYKRIVTGGKGSRPVAILFPPNLQSYIDLIVKIRSKTNLVPHNNQYLFGCPGTTKWTRGDVVIRKFAEAANLKFPLQITSNKLRKQIATVMQILNLTKEETEQFAQFMGHTEKTHNEYYKLPQDIYQTAKISKILLLMEKGVDTYKGKSLHEIDINPDNEYAEEESDNDDVYNVSNTNLILPNVQVQDKPDEEPQKPKLTGRISWNKQQIQLVTNHFKDHIKLKKAPKKNECVELITKYGDIFHNKDWIRVKTFVYNAYRNK